MQKYDFDYHTCISGCGRQVYIDGGTCTVCIENRERYLMSQFDDTGGDEKVGSYNRNTCKNCGTFCYDADDFCENCAVYSSMTASDQLRVQLREMSLGDFLAINNEELRNNLVAFMREV